MTYKKLPGEKEVCDIVSQHKDWEVLSTDHKEENVGQRVIFYLESRQSRRFSDIDGEVRNCKPLYVTDFEAGRVKREPEMVARQIINTANTMLSENMRALGK